MGRPKIHLDVGEVERLAGLGLTEEQIAINLGVAYNTLLERKRQYPEFLQAIQHGRAKAITRVTNVAMDLAVQGDAHMVRYWLNNMARGQWRDKHEVEHSGSMEHTITVIDPGCGHVGPDKTD